MLQPHEIQLDLPIELFNGVMSTTTKVWEILSASYRGDLETVKQLAGECPELLYAQYNYTPPIHFAVREGHTQLVEYLLNEGAHDPAYKIYPFLDPLETIAEDRGYADIVLLLQQYAAYPARQKYKGDNGRIIYNRSPLQQEFEDAVHTNDYHKTEALLKAHPGLTADQTYFWGEGILMKPVQHQERELTELLLRYGATVPDVLKWTQAYYFKFHDSAAHIIQHGMNPDTQSWQHVSILHDMAQKGDIAKAGLLLQHGAAINPIDEEYQSTPLGMAARWGQIEMVEYLLKEGADPNISGATWSTPLAWARKKGFEGIEKLLIDAGATL